MAAVKKKRKRGGASMPCPECGSHSHVIITKRIDDKVERQRECLGRRPHKFHTYEEVSYEAVSSS